MAEKKKILYIVEAMGGGVFTYIVDLANELVNSYDMYNFNKTHAPTGFDSTIQHLEKTSLQGIRGSTV